MSNRSNPNLRLHVESPPAEEPAPPVARLASVLSAFGQATGWLLRYEHSPASLGEAWSATIGGPAAARGRLVMSPPVDGAERGGNSGTLSLQDARPLALAIAGLVTELNELRHALWQREAELAAGVPVAARQGNERHLAERLECVLKSGAQSVGCQAAGLYLLDEFTTELKLRAAWGLPVERLIAPARPLRGAVADLEALVGNAVVLEDTSLLPHWRCPEPFAAAVCVPVSSPTTPLGTLWVFSDAVRDFTPQETNLLEIIAGRLAADLEREMLIAAGASAKQRDKQFAAAARWQADRLPRIAPLLDGYEVAGLVEQPGELGGAFYDWTVLADGRLAVSAAAAEGAALTAALSAASVQMAVKSHAAHPHSAGELVSRVNESIASASAGDQQASLAYAALSTDDGQVELSLAGDCVAILAASTPRLIASNSPRLGEMPDTDYRFESIRLRPGEALILVSGAAKLAPAAAAGADGETVDAAACVAEERQESAAAIAQHAARVLSTSQLDMGSLAVVVVKRRSS